MDRSSIVQGLLQRIEHEACVRRARGPPAQKVQGYGMGGFGQGPYGMSYLAIEVSQTDPKNMEVSMLFEVVIRFWRDFLLRPGPLNPLPKGKTKLSDE